MSPTPGDSSALAHRIVPDLVDRAAAERPIEVDQSNTSVVVGDTVIVKWLDPPAPMPHAGLQLTSHLREVGFAAMPLFHGASVNDGAVVALVSEYVAGSVDGWEWFVDELTGWADGHVDRAAITTSARRLGSLTAELHVALATPSTIIPEPVSAGRVTHEARRCRRLLADVEALGDGPWREVVRPRLDEIRGALGTLDELGDGATPAVQPIHGDLHVGQVMRSGTPPDDRLVVIDFDGDPLAEPSSPRHARPAAVDVASLVQSIDHAGRVAIRRRGDAVDLLDTIISDAADTALSAYRDGLAARRRTDLLDDRLLWPLRVAQELHELLYAARRLPRWSYAPLATLTAMFP